LPAVSRNLDPQKNKKAGKTPTFFQADRFLLFSSVFSLHTDLENNIRLFSEVIKSDCEKSEHIFIWGSVPRADQ